MRKSLTRLSAFLMTGLMVTSAIPVNAESKYQNSVETIDYYEASDDEAKTTTVYAEIKSDFAVTIPKTIVLNGSTKQALFDVSASGDIAGNEELSIVPDNTFVLHEQAGKKNDELASITATKTTWDVNDIANNVKAENNKIEASGITAGAWSGTFNFGIALNATGDYIKIEQPTPDTPDEEVKGVVVQMNASLEVEPVRLSEGETKELEPTYYGVNVANKCTYKSEDTNIATVDDNGTITGVKEGETNIVIGFNTTNAAFSPVLEVKIPVAIDASMIQQTGTSLLTGKEVNVILKRLVKSSAKYDTAEETITEINFIKADNLPTGTSIDTEDHTAATLSGTIMNVYFDTDRLILNEDSSLMFLAFRNVTKITGLEYFDTSNVTNMQEMFEHAGYIASSFSIGDLSNWDVSNVTDMGWMFNSAGYKATTFNIGNLSNWDTSSVTNMQSMFYCAGQNATTFNIEDLSNWDVSNVTNMRQMFSYAGQKATPLNIGDLSNWDVSNVTDMTYMFYATGYKANYQAPSWYTGPTR